MRSHDDDGGGGDDDDGDDASILKEQSFYIYSWLLFCFVFLPKFQFDI